jgi:uncharacterized membrane protein
MDIFSWLTGTNLGEFCFTMLVSMLPVIELRGGIPFGVARGLPLWAAFLAAYVGNLLPVPFVIVYGRRFLHWLRHVLPKLGHWVDRLERKIHRQGAKVLTYEYLGLFLLVAVPLPGTGAWTGALVAAFLDLRLRRALPTIALGVLTAGAIISVLTALALPLF